MKKIISILLIIIGIMTILTPFIMEQVVKYNNRYTISKENIDRIIKANNNDNDSQAKFDFSAINDIDIWSLAKASKNFDRKLIIGTILIPELNIHLPIMKGLSNSNLMVGAATMKPNQSFGNGNYTLAGHYMKNKDLLFGRLMDIELGHTIYISDGSKLYQYRVYDKIVVSDTNIDILSDKKAEERGKPIVSLMTCYYSSKTGKRFFALGELLDEYAIE